MHFRTVIPFALACFAASSAGAQGIPGLPGGAGLPDVSRMGVPNVAGVLGYCVKNKFLGGGSANSVIDGLKGKAGVTSSPEYRSGEAGNIITGNASPVSIGSMPAQLKTQACNAVLRHGTSLL
jgi:hypothetical protein